MNRKQTLAAARRAAANNDHALAAALFASAGVSYVATTRTESKISAVVSSASEPKTAKTRQPIAKIKSDMGPAPATDLALPKSGSNPTTEQFSAYQAAFDYFNRALFGGELRPVILNFSRKAKSLGFFAPMRWGKDGAEKAVRHEISLNPSYLAMRPAKETMSTLVHEMCHLWQQDHGKPPRGGYHDREWGAKMEAVGLMPSNTGLPGGKKTGDRMTHYIIQGGPFEKAFEAIPAEYLLPWASAEPDIEKKPRVSSKVKFTCSGCEANAWGKPGLRIICDTCAIEMESAS